MKHLILFPKTLFSSYSNLGFFDLQTMRETCHEIHIWNKQIILSRRV